jgi:hypothetical protein
MNGTMQRDDASAGADVANIHKQKSPAILIMRTPEWRQESVRHDDFNL